jgi:hypothetical protein
MYRDVDVMEISSDDECNSWPKNKGNPTADIEYFFEAARYLKGEKRGRRRCKACAYVINACYLLLSHLLVGMEMGDALKQIASWLMSIPHFGGTWLRYTRYVSIGEFLCSLT